MIRPDPSPPATGRSPQGGPPQRRLLLLVPIIGGILLLLAAVVLVIVIVMGRIFPGDEDANPGIYVSVIKPTPTPSASPAPAAGCGPVIINGRRQSLLEVYPPRD